MEDYGASLGPRNRALQCAIRLFCSSVAALGRRHGSVFLWKCLSDLKKTFLTASCLPAVFAAAVRYQSQCSDGMLFDLSSL